jgi:DNA-binding transcriptional ArsR family regulator
MTYIYVINQFFMASSKKDLFTPEQQKNAELFKALSHPARLAILEYLAQTKSCITGDISEVLPLGRTTVNQHLAELKSVGLIQGTIGGTKTYYCLNPLRVEELNLATQNFISRICCADNCCDV